MKIEHIKASGEFRRVLSRGKKQKERTVQLSYIKDAGQGKPRIGVIITKKSVPRAVDRSYIKRLIYDFFKKSGAKPEESFTAVVRFTGCSGKISKKNLGKMLREDLGKAAGEADLIR